MNEALLARRLNESAVALPERLLALAPVNMAGLREGLLAYHALRRAGHPAALHFGVLRGSLQGADPQQISRILNEIGTLYVRQNVERKAAEAEKSIAFLNSQLPDLRKQLEASEGQFNQFQIGRAHV